MTGVRSQESLGILFRAFFVFGGHMIKEKDIKYTSIDEQVQHLLSKNLIINDLDFAREKLLQYGYYNIVNSYKTPYLIIENGRKIFSPNTTFEQLFSLFTLDHNLRNAILSSMLALEEHLKAASAEVLAFSFGVNQNEYLKWENYRDRKVKHERFGLKYTLKTLQNNAMSDKDPIKYYRESYGIIPPWILFKGTYFSTMVNFIRLFKEKQKNQLIKYLYDCPDEMCQLKDIKSLLFNTLSICLEYRNLAAHGGRVYNYIPNATIRIDNPNSLVALDSDISTSISSQGLSLLLNLLSLFSYKEPHEIISTVLRKEINRHLDVYEKDLDILAETLNLVIYTEREDVIIHKGKEYPIKSILRSGLHGVLLKEIPDELRNIINSEEQAGQDS